MTKYKIGIWGQFGDGSRIADGQAVRTTIITREIEKRYGIEKVRIVNTNKWKRHPVRFLYRSIRLVSVSEKIVIFPADNGFRIIVPLLLFFNAFFKRELYYVVIGGFLPELLYRNSIYISMLRRFNQLFVQTTTLKKDLERVGLRNVDYLTNLKPFQPLPMNSIALNDDENIKVCFLSRITEDKGIVDAVDAVKLANISLGNTRIKLDIFGIIEEQFKNEFDQLLESSSGMVEYKGVIDYDKTSDVIKDYFALIIPTYFHGEGFPGCFVDAFFAGLPVIASDWLYNEDIIKDGVNGLIVPVKDPNAVCNALLKLYNDRKLAYDIMLNNVSESYKYSTQAVLRSFFSYID